jgi:hypothetical protein
MPMLQTYSLKLNNQFHPDRIEAFAAARVQHFAAGKPLDLSFLEEDGTPLHRAWKSYIAKLPMSVSEALRAVIHYALSTKPPTPINFSWAPGYDYELNMWQAPDTKLTRGGITVLLKSRYPDDKHPLEK